ncbi:hypothetical protein [Phytoactinopolyspora halophila]|uniref:hypothetical protein n=1 Tax=Phytoactinopolyspora halophila TaxID=1981511 RepID=UPI001B8BB41C|nr:hypothetical protein [Phytoactinopolyspora halophila]
MTAAGWGVYEAPDVAASEGVAFAADAAPGLLEPFLVRDDHSTDGDEGNGECPGHTGARGRRVCVGDRWESTQE